MAQGKINERDRESDIRRRNNLLVIYEDVKIYDYAHRGFMKLRAADGISMDMIHYSFSLDNSKTLEQAKKAGESQGKSGSFFFFSHDKRFIIKTMFTSELDEFILNIEDYFYYLDKNPNSLIARIYGIYQIKMRGIIPINFLIMGNSLNF